MFRTSKLFLLSASILCLFFITTGLISPSFNEQISVWVLLASVFIVGIPHGAIDHIVASELFESRRGLRGHLLFYSSYLLIMALLGAVWILSPPAGMVIFLAISVYHFGQADMEDFISEEHSSFFWNILRGTFIIGLILFSNTDKTLPVIADATGYSEGVFQSISSNSVLLLTGLIVIYFTYSIYSIYRDKISSPIIFISDGALLVTLFLITGPFIGFALYFAVWHSSGHIYEMIRFFEKRNKSFGLREFILQSLPFTIISFTGLGILYYFHTFLGTGKGFITLMFILISVLTLPHMVIVDKMYDNYKS